jgi:Excalibur calcium-binding domain
MLRTAKTSLIVVAMTASTLAFAGPAEAVTDFRSCTQLHRAFKNGVALSHAAAHRQERSGHRRPAVRPAVYRANRESDADRDGTACEVVDR